MHHRDGESLPYNALPSPPSFPSIVDWHRVGAEHCERVLRAQVLSPGRSVAEPTRSIAPLPSPRRTDPVSQLINHDPTWSALAGQLATALTKV